LLRVIKTLSVTDFKKHCTSLLREMQTTREPILVTSRKQPLARIEPAVPKGKHPAWGVLSGSVISMDETFDEPMGDEEWEAAGGSFF
jgi:antitoxin (DNA-binding transcriptional repressor) of toxin-antitoxin stability system